MFCPSCRSANPAQARFCMNCGLPLVQGKVCPGCHTLLPPEANFCFHCGAYQPAPAGYAAPGSAAISA
ncbi:MAG: double zinc ribbon domain-containing protein, partial [Chloroflexota bacterium]